VKSNTTAPTECKVLETATGSSDRTPNCWQIAEVKVRDAKAQIESLDPKIHFIISCMSEVNYFVDLNWKYQLGTGYTDSDKFLQVRTKNIDIEPARFTASSACRGAGL